jgi:hypothetical protein
MAKFRLPPLSPLLGSTIINFIRVTTNRKVDVRYYFKLTTTFLLVLIGGLFHWIDALYFRRKTQGFSLQEPPVFVIGHWRSGTTLLHNLLSCDQRVGYTTTYHSVFPNNLRSKWLFKTFMRIFMPRHRPGDAVELNPDYPQEDEYALSNMTPESFYHFFYFPKYYREYYDKYIRFEGMHPSNYERWKKRYNNLVTRALINTSGKRIVLKNPVNTGRIKTLLDIYPDARFIFLHRNPVTTFLSSQKFFGNLFPTLNLHRFSNDSIKEMIVENYQKILKDYLNDRALIPEGNLIEIGYDALNKSPIETIKTIYRHFNLDGYRDTEKELKAYVISQKNHRLDPYNLDKDDFELIKEKFDFAFKEWQYDMPKNVAVE